MDTLEWMYLCLWRLSCHKNALLFCVPRSFSKLHPWTPQSLRISRPHFICHIRYGEMTHSSLIPRGCSSSSKNVIFQLILKIDAMNIFCEIAPMCHRNHWWQVNIVWGNGLVPLGNGPLLELILTLNVRGSSYLGLTRSISWLLMPWLLTSPRHQQPWYWLYRICRSFYLRKCFKSLCQINVEEWHKMQIYMFMFPQKKLARKGLTEICVATSWYYGVTRLQWINILTTQMWPGISRSHVVILISADHRKCIGNHNRLKKTWKKSHIRLWSPADGQAPLSTRTHVDTVMPKSVYKQHQYLKG